MSDLAKYVLNTARVKTAKPSAATPSTAPAVPALPTAAGTPPPPSAGRWPEWRGAIPERFLERLLGNPRSLISGEELVAMQAAETNWLRWHEAVLAHSADAAARVFAEQGDKTAEAIRAGEPIPQARSFHEIHRDFQHRQQHVKTEMMKDSAEPRRIVQNIIGRIRTIAVERLATEEAAAREYAEAWGVPFEPSPTLRILESIAHGNAPFLRPAEGYPVRPSSALKTLGISLDLSK